MERLNPAKKPRRIIAAVTNDLVQDQRMHRICSSLTDEGYQVMLVGRTYCKQSTNSSTIEPPAYWRRLTCVFRRGVWFYAEFNLRLFVFLLQHPFDAVCAVDTDTLPACFLASRLKKRPCVLDAHEYFSEVPELVNRPFIKWFWETLAAWIIPRLQFAYTVGPILARVLSQRYGIPFDVVRNVPRRRHNTEMVSHPQTPLILLYQGMLNEGRGLEALIKSVERLDNVQLWIAGKGDKEKSLAAQAAPYLASGTIKWWGFLHPDDLQSLTAKADIGINLLENKGLSYRYSLANKAFDYIQAGIPSIQMDFPEYLYLQEKYGVFQCIPNLEPDTIADAIRYLQENPEVYFRLRKNCLNAATELNWELESHKLIQIYERIFDARSSF